MALTLPQIQSIRQRDPELADALLQLVKHINENLVQKPGTRVPPPAGKTQ